MYRIKQDQLTSGIENAFVILPEKTEYYNFGLIRIDTNLKKDDPGDFIYRFTIFDEISRCMIKFVFFQDLKIKDPLDILNQFPDSGPLPNEGALSRRKIGQRVWSRRATEDDCHFYVADKQIGVGVFITRVRKIRGKADIPLVPITNDEVRFAEDIVLKMLDRLTVLGLTSRPKESAPDWAKRQVEKRLTSRRG